MILMRLVKKVGKMILAISRPETMKIGKMIFTKIPGGELQMDRRVTKADNVCRVYKK